MWREEGHSPIDTSSPVLDYVYRPGNIYPHTIVMRKGTYNHEYYGDMFRTKHSFSERHKWLLDNVGPGGYHSLQYQKQMWFAHENDEPSVCFLRENDAVLFKMWWC